MTEIDYAINAKVAAGYRQNGWWRDVTVLDDLAKSVARSPDDVAIVVHRQPGLERLTYRELDEVSMQFAAGLLALGVGEGEIVSVQLPNCWEFFALHLALARVGAVMNPITPILRRREVTEILTQTRSRLFIGRREFRNFDYAEMLVGVQQAVPSLSQIVLMGGAGVQGVRDFDATFRTVALSTEQRELLGARRPAADAPAEVAFTSGTTGGPKGVVHTYNTLFLGAMSAVEPFELESADVMLMASPLGHQTGFVYGMLVPLLLGMKVVLQEVWDPGEALRLIDAEGVTVTMGSTTFLLDMCAAVEQGAPAPTTLRLFICGGAPIPDFAARLCQERLGAVCMACWGGTEVGIATATRLSDPIETVSSTDGGPLPWSAVKAVDDDGRTLPPDAEGELLIKTAAQHVTYLGRPDLYDAAVRDGWYYTGDVGRVNEARYVRITGRKKDLIIRGGENIPALEIESALVQHPKVKEIAIVGRPHERFGEIVCAVIVPEDLAHPPTLTELTEFLDERGMTKTFWPQDLVCWDVLPRTDTGKVQKFRVREQLAASSGAAVQLGEQL